MKKTNSEIATVLQQDATFAGQRKINLIWEYTQSAIALGVTLACMITGTYIGITGRGEFPPILSNSAFLILGFYFSRTNHSAIGGIGPKPNQEYLGR